MIRRIDDELALIPYYDDFDTALPWYQDRQTCWQCDKLDGVYTLERLKAMYGFLSTHGDCYYIEYRGVLVGDVTLRDNDELCIVVSRDYQNRHIGRRCIEEMLRLAREKGLTQVKANIYDFNAQSRRMFLSCGFEETSDEWFVRSL